MELRDKHSSHAEAGEMDDMEQSPQIREWYRARATQERERKWILSVMRDFERRTPLHLRNGNSRSQDSTSSSSHASPLTRGRRGPTSRTPAAASTPTPTPTPTPMAAAARGQDHPRSRVPPTPSRANPSSLSSKRLRRRRGEGAHRTSPCSAPAGAAAAGGCDLCFLRGGKDGEETVHSTSVAAAALGFSQGSSSSSSSNSSSAGTAATTATRGRAVVRGSPYSCGAYSPVDLRSAGLGGEGGGLGLGSPPAGVVLSFGEGGVEESSSPPRPRAFWREEWLRGSGGGGTGGDGCGALECPRRERRPALAASDNSYFCTLDERAPGDRVGATRRGCCCGNDSSFRGECCGRHGCCCCSSNGNGNGSTSGGGKGLQPRRCCSNKSLFRDARVKKACCGGSSGDVAGGRRADSPPSATRCCILSGTQAEQRRREGNEQWREQRTGTGTGTGTADSNSNNTVSCGEAKTSAGSEGVSAVGLVFLAAVAVAAFACGTLVGPPSRNRLPPPPLPPPPSASPSEYAPLFPPHQAYEPTSQEGLCAKTRGTGGVAGVSSIDHAPAATAEGKGGSRTDAVAEAGGGGVGGAGRVEAAASAASARGAGRRAGIGTAGGEEEATPKGVPSAAAAEVNECDRTCAEPLVSGGLIATPGHETTPSTCCFSAQAAAAPVGGRHGRHHCPSFVCAAGESGGGSVPGTAAVSSAPGGAAIAGAGSGGHDAGAAEADPSRRSTPPFSSPGAGAAAAAAAARARASREGSRLRQRTERVITRPPAGSTPAAFAKTLGLAEQSLADFAAIGGDEEAERAIARRAAMSESAARSACKSLAWGKAALVTAAGPDPDPHDDGGVCDSVGKDSNGGLGVDGLPATRQDDRSGGGYGQAVEQTAVEAAAAAAAAGVADDDEAVLMSTKDPGHDEECSLADFVGLGPSSTPLSLATTTAASKTKEATGGASRSQDVHSRTTSGLGQGSPPLGPRCRALVVSGSDIQASWAGRYVPVRAVEGGRGDASQVPKAAAASSTQRMHPQTPYYYYCLVPCSASRSGDSAGAEGGEGRVLREAASKGGEHAPPPPPPSLSDVLVGGERPTGGAAAADRPETLATAAGGKSPTCSTMAEMGSENELGSSTTPATTATAAATVETPAAVASPRLPSPPAVGSATGAAVAAPENDPGLQEVAAGGVLCLYWADVGGGGRWVLDDDLRLSNGVLAVTKGPAPAAADLAFPSRRREPLSPQEKKKKKKKNTSSGDGDGVGGEAAAGSREGSEAKDDVSRDGGGGGGAGQDEVRLPHGDASAEGDRRLPEAASGEEGGVEGAVVGEEAEGAGTRALRVWGEGQPTWLLDSPRLQDWAEADNVSVECETVW